MQTVVVRAEANVLGLVHHEEATVPLTDEVAALIAKRMLSLPSADGSYATPTVLVPKSPCGCGS